MESNVKKSDLVLTDDKVAKMAEYAISAYFNMSHVSDSYDEFLSYVTASNNISEINSTDFKKFFNVRVVLDYMIDQNINISNMPKEELSLTIKEASKTVVSNLRKVANKTTLVKDVNDESELTSEFVINTLNENMVSILSSIYNAYRNNGIPYYIQINRGVLMNRKDTISVKTTDKLLDDTLDILNKVMNKYGDYCLEPMPLSVDLGNFGYIDLKSDYIHTVYNELMVVIDELLTSNGIIANNPNEKVNALNELLLKDPEIKSKLLFNLTGILKNRLLPKNEEEMVIETKPPVVSFEDAVDLTTDEINSILAESNKTHFEEVPRIDRAMKYEKYVDEISSLNKKMIGPNETETTLLDYLESEDVLNRIPDEAIITLEEGQTMTGEEFIRNKIVPYALEVGNSNIDMIMNAYGAKIKNQQEKVGFLSKIFK